MNSIAVWLGAISLSFAMVGYPHKSDAQGFDGTQFLTWSQAAQDSYIQTSITMAAIIATTARPPIGDCLDAWYLAGDADREGLNEEIRATIGRNAEFHPSSVIYLILEQQCGSFAE